MDISGPAEVSRGGSSRRNCFNLMASFFRSVPCGRDRQGYWYKSAAGEWSASVGTSASVKKPSDIDWDVACDTQSSPLPLVPFPQGELIGVNRSLSYEKIHTSEPSSTATW